PTYALALHDALPIYRVYGDRKALPSTRLGVAKVLRDAFVQAENYRAKREHALAEGKPVERDLTLETLAAVLDGELVWDQHTHRQDRKSTRLNSSHVK